MMLLRKQCYLLLEKYGMSHLSPQCRCGIIWQGLSQGRSLFVVLPCPI